MTEKEEGQHMGQSPEIEGEEIAAARQGDLLESAVQATCDRIARLAALALDIPIVYLSLLEPDGRWTRCAAGLADIDRRRERWLCEQTIKQAFPMIIPDLETEPGFARNRPRADRPQVRFYAGAPLRTADGRNIGSLCCFDTQVRIFSRREVDILSDLARIVVDELDLRRLATTDPLTGAMTRRAFFEALDRSIALARRHGHDVGCLLFDVDHFKQVNDRCGHDAGDHVLQRVVAICKADSRASDFLGRLGGEEFALIMPLTTGEAAMVAAERLRQDIAGDAGLAAIAQQPVTASFGVTAYNGEADDATSLLKRADLALYAAKTGGRNRCVFYSDRLAAKVA